MPDVVIAGVPVPDPFDKLTAYAQRYAGTVRHYDLAPHEHPDRLALDEVARTWKIASRISKRERRWFVDRAAEAEPALWQAVPHDADLADADPAEAGGLYDAAEALYDHFRRASPRHVATAKVSKVLHLKRPALYPILDSQVMRKYHQTARDAARAYPSRGYRFMHWAAIRDDLIHNRPALSALKAECAADPRDDVAALARLSDLRIQDILTW